MIREQAGVSQGDVAEALGVTRPAVSYWETGRREPRGENRRRYVELLGRLARESLPS